MNLYELKIGYRYTRGAKTNKNKFVSFSSLMSMLGIVIGVAALIITLSVMNGFKQNTISKMLSKIPHVMVKSLSENEIIETPQLEEFLNTKSGLQSVKKEYVLSAFTYVMKSKDSDWEDAWGIFLNGVSQNEYAKLEPGKFNVLVSRELAEKRNIKVGDYLSISLANHKTITPVGSFNTQKSFKVVDYFEHEDKTFKNIFVIINDKDAKSFSKLEYPNVFKIDLDDFWGATELKNEIIAKTAINKNKDLEINDWATLNKRLLTLLKIEKVIAMIILVLVIVVASFNMISTMVMSVADKKGEIAILRTLGCRPSSVMTIFMFQGCFVGFIGTAIGTVVGVSIAMYVNEIVMFVDAAFKFNFLTDVLNEMKVSSVIIPSEILTIIGLSLLITLLSAVYPSWLASKVDPAEALKHE